MEEGNHEGDYIKWVKCVKKTVVRLLVRILAVLAGEQHVCACSKNLRYMQA